MILIIYTCFVIWETGIHIFTFPYIYKFITFAALDTINNVPILDYTCPVCRGNCSKCSTVSLLKLQKRAAWTGTKQLWFWNTTPWTKNDIIVMLCINKSLVLSRVLIPKLLYDIIVMASEVKEKSDARNINSL